MSSDKPKALSAHLQEWLDRLQQAEALGPEIQRAKSLAEWQAQAYPDIEPHLDDQDRDALDQHLDLSYSSVMSALPLPPIYTIATGVTSSSAVAAGTLSTFGFALKLRDAGATLRPAVQRHILSFEQLQSESDRASEVRILLEKLSPTLAALFELASKGPGLAELNQESIPAAALEMRNLVDGLQGELIEKERSTPRENMPWEKMAYRLARPLTRDISHALLLEQGEERGKLVARLSDLMKRRSEATSGELADLWSLVLEHIYIVCSNLTDTVA